VLTLFGCPQCSKKHRLSLEQPSVAGSLVTGFHFTCAIRERNEVWCWGLDVANLKTMDGSPPVRIDGIKDVVELAAGENHVCARHNDGRVSCWGLNNTGQAGRKETGRFGPVVVEGIDGARTLAASRSSTCAIHQGGKVACWGSPFLDKQPETNARPRTIAAISNAVALALGPHHACALLQKGTVRCWGDNRYGQLGIGTISPNGEGEVAGLSDVIAISAGLVHTCVVNQSGRAICWGGNQQGQLGSGGFENSSVPKTVTSITKVTAVSAGHNHTCAISDGKLACWGDNESGQLGDGSLTTRNVPVWAALPKHVVAVAGGGSHTCAMLHNKRVLCFGLNLFRQGGVHASVGLRPVVKLTDATEISAGYLHTCARRRDASVVCWGHNDGKQIAPFGETRNIPVKVPGVARVRSLAGGNGFHCAIQESGQVLCWGNQPPSVKIERFDPAPRLLPGIKAARTIAASDSHVCVIHSRGDISCMGSNWAGQLGDGSTDDRKEPVRVRGLTGTKALALANGQSCAILMNGQLHCWGRPPIRDGPPRLRPRPIPAFSNLVEVSLGVIDGCTRDLGSNVSCWGDLAEGTRQAVVSVDLRDAIEIGVGTGFACGLRHNGEVHCWVSQHKVGLFGDTVKLGTVPKEIPNLGLVAEISVGDRHACARHSNGTVVCWGDNTYGQLGVGMGRYDALPVEALGSYR